MLRPQGLPIDALVDATVQAHGLGRIERRFEASQLPRLSEAGLVEPGEIRIAIRFSTVDGRVALNGELSGYVTMTCQRCMQPARVDVTDQFQLIVVDDEAERQQQEDAGSGYEPIIADATRFDLRWLAEEQTLLNVPLVPKHADESCAAPVKAVQPTEQPSGQRPFANLRNMLRDK
jgi:uncharacterized protein